MRQLAKLFAETSSPATRSAADDPAPRPRRSCSRAWRKRRARPRRRPGAPAQRPGPLRPHPAAGRGRAVRRRRPPHHVRRPLLASRRAAPGRPHRGRHPVRALRLRGREDDHRPPDDVSVLYDRGYGLVLTTCTPRYSASHRLIVWGSLVSFELRRAPAARRAGPAAAARRLRGTAAVRRSPVEQEHQNRSPASRARVSRRARRRARPRGPSSAGSRTPAARSS